MMKLKSVLILCLLGSAVGDVQTKDSLTLRHDPPEHQQSDAKYAITEARLKEIRGHFMYWYFDSGDPIDKGDLQDIQISVPQLHKNLHFELPFFGFRFNYIRVSLNGYLEFSDPPFSDVKYPLVFPERRWPDENDQSFIGIFYSKCRVGSMRTEDLDRRKEGVYFRVERDLRSRSDQFGVELRERVKWDIREGIVGAETFEPKHAIITTWKNVSFAGGISQSLFLTNTFQLVLATDEVYTYAIFNYLDLQWTSHTEAGGDVATGDGGIPAFVGFNAGNGTRSYEYVPYSQTSIIRDLLKSGWGNGFPGRHIFRIDESILSGSCTYGIDGSSLPLHFAPQSGNMLGGTTVNITGPCFKPTDKVICRFDATDVYGTVVSRNRAICVQPQLFAEGYINLKVAIENGRYKWKGKYFVENPSTATEKIFFNMPHQVHEKHPPSIDLSWSLANLTINQNVNVTFSLWGYRETTSKPEFLYIDELDKDVPNSGRHVIITEKYEHRNNGNLLDIKFGFIRINTTQPTSSINEIVPVIWSRPIPLGWYFAPQWKRKYGEDWSEALCNEWINEDQKRNNFTQNLPQCPCTLEQALADRGRYKADPDCDKDYNPTCIYHNGALHCVLTGVPTKSGGSEQQCCYDRNGFLMLSFDQQWGSSPRRSHILGEHPWNEVNKVPSLSQWHNDVIPKHLCCMWQHEHSDGCEALRTVIRPTDDCVAYKSPGIAGTYGNGHIITYDDVPYTFNGKGEFALLRAEDTDGGFLEIQGRFEQPPKNAYGEVKTTRLTSVVAREKSSAVIEIKLRPRESQWRYRLDVYANWQRIYFDRPNHKSQHFEGVTVYSPSYILNQSQVIVMFDSGAGLEVIEDRGYMTVVSYMPRSFINKTKGLFGKWTFDMSDDFVDPNGNVLNVSNTVSGNERIYYDFGLNWMVDDRGDPKKGRSLFVRSYNKGAASYNDNNFKPEFRLLPEDFIPQNRTLHVNKAYEFCTKEEIECLYDHAITLDKDLAYSSMQQKNMIMKMKEITKAQIVSCGVLKTPKFGRKSTFRFVPGTRVIFECQEGYQLDGDQKRECLSDGHWNKGVHGYTKCIRN